MADHLERDHRGDVDDIAAPRRLRIARGHASGDRLRGEERALEVGVQDLVPIGLGLLEHRLGDRDAGVVDQDVERAERALDLVQRALDRGALGHIERDARRATARRSDLPAELLELVRLARGEADRGAAVGQRASKAPAEALRGAGHQGDAAAEVERIAHDDGPSSRIPGALCRR